MRKLVLSLVALAVAATLALLDTSPAAAAYKTVCEPGSGTSSGKCYKQMSAVIKRIKVVDAVPLINASSKTATMHCSFSSSVTREITLGGSASISGGAEVSLLKIASASVATTYTLEASVTMSATQAKEAGGSVTLKPGEKVVCQRIYSHVTFTVKPYTYSGTQVFWGTEKSVTVPSSLGVRIVD